MQKSSIIINPLTLRFVSDLHSPRWSSLNHITQLHVQETKDTGSSSAYSTHSPTTLSRITVKELHYFYNAWPWAFWLDIRSNLYANGKKNKKASSEVYWGRLLNTQCKKSFQPLLHKNEWIKNLHIVVLKEGAKPLFKCANKKIFEATQQWACAERETLYNQ